MLKLWDGINKDDKQFNRSHRPAQNQTINWLMFGWSTFNAKTSHEQLKLIRLTTA
jgi:hypothetical protein